VGIKVTPDWFVNYLTISSGEQVQLLNATPDFLRFTTSDGVRKQRVFRGLVFNKFSTFLIL